MQDIECSHVFAADLVHGSKVEFITKNSQNKVKDTDALVTKEKGLFLSVSVADCLPINFYDPVKKVVGIAHAGWRGVIKKIVVETLRVFGEAGSDKKNIHVEFGPHILSCHFKVQSDILSEFDEYKEFIIERDGEMYIDLQSIVKKQLTQSGVPEENITTTNVCTFCEKNTFFSYRRDKPEEVQAMVAFIGIRE